MARYVARRRLHHHVACSIGRAREEELIAIPRDVDRLVLRHHVHAEDISVIHYLEIAAHERRYWCCADHGDCPKLKKVWSRTPIRSGLASSAQAPVLFVFGPEHHLRSSRQSMRTPWMSGSSALTIRSWHSPVSTNPSDGSSTGCGKEGRMDTDLADALRALNRRERFLVIGWALDRLTFQLGWEFKSRLQRVLMDGRFELEVPADAFIAMDYPMLWVEAALDWSMGGMRLSSTLLWIHEIEPSNTRASTSTGRTRTC